MVLDGRRASIAGPLEIEIVADANFVGSASLVAITEIALGGGSALGAEYTPLVVTEPHAVPAHPALLTALCTLQVTLVLPLPPTCATNCCVLGVPVEGGMNAYAGDTTTLTPPGDPEKKIVALAFRDDSAWLAAVSVTLPALGVDAGAK
jgi:hypothetical protein